MRLETLLLADHAAATPDGKLYINGGGITHLNAPAIPFLLPGIAIVARFEITEADAGDHSLLLQMRNPDKVDLLPPTPATITVAPPTGHPDETNYAQVVFQFGMVPILVAGTHVLTLELDEKIVRRLKLPVVPTDSQ